ncbi:MAG: 7,8-didemethyl-8-hydroxy-5-deazariboflavin synthase subunit CofG [ANME-2 cluster archaeon]|nr:7,8-didemethyl-8-hydroxy-5-deazariboflavin synthase subunit CofG [ANME-2 cluster archaeon]
MTEQTRMVTYSRNVFIPVTNICRNHCGYCGFRRNPDDPQAYIIHPDRVAEILQRGAGSGCTEALFTFGERPEEDIRYLERLKTIGYERTLDYLLDLCRMAINAGLLPHCNPGVLSYEELALLKPFNASMGLMLETTAQLQAHDNSPGKVPQKRIESIAHAGKLKIPFTTGLLVGIGETRSDRVDSLRTITGLHRKYGHIQEVIIQNFTPKPDTPMAGHEPPSFEEMLWTVEQARDILPDDVAVQVPPNLITPGVLIKHGASDLGGISSETIDHINPEHKWPDVEELKQTAGKDTVLRERLPIYPKYILDKWFSEELRSLIHQLSDDEGYRKTTEIELSGTMLRKL